MCLIDKQKCLIKNIGNRKKKEKKKYTAKYTAKQGDRKPRPAKLKVLQGVTH